MSQMVPPLSVVSVLKAVWGVRVNVLHVFWKPAESLSWIFIDFQNTRETLTKHLPKHLQTLIKSDVV